MGPLAMAALYIYSGPSPADIDFNAETSLPNLVHWEWCWKNDWIQLWTLSEILRCDFFKLSGMAYAIVSLRKNKSQDNDIRIGFKERWDSADSSCQNHLTPSLADLQWVERWRYRSFRSSPWRHDVVSNARLPLDPPAADKLSLGQAEFSMVGNSGINRGKFLKCSVGFREFWCTMVHDYRAI